ncbi:hypothetical protein BDY21DRAFT_331573 [Lineolata rhizophorae]|uniref:Uncharacterized protein n=1 Tax=Lineolata rhizophorae TaxID=578093 RepID=A0A6A6PBT5_9PEZI|nr:hypothetical protein BDY21DRAFT_331573 [Lineolata rhizophorae]
MGGSSPAAEVDGYGHLTIQRALDIARNSEGGVDPAVARYLELCLHKVWARLHAHPDSYVLSKDEFALFNYYRQRFQDSPVAQRAIQRFWDNHVGSAAGVQ